MNRIIISFFIVLLSASGLQAQSSVIDRYFNKYQEDERFSAITVSSRMFGLFADFDMEDPNEQELVEALSKLKGLKMLIGEQVDNATSMFKQVKTLTESQMDELMSIKEGNKDFTFYITEANGTISELLMVGHEQEKFMMMSLVGEIDLREISRLSKKMDIDGFQHLQNLGQ